MRTQIILAGVGGQGILFASKIFSELGLRLGLNVLGSETHGMSQRGGSVIAHLKLGDFHSPVIRSGQADFLYSFDAKETYRAFGFLKEGSVCFANFEGTKRFDPRVLSYLKGRKIVFKACDAGQTASRIGFSRSANIVLIGYSVGTGLVPFKYEDLKSVLKLVSRRRDLAANLKAFDVGYQDGMK